ncbi:hypothetical protein [Streptomyces sp. SID13031]|uniref:hypothetical protein n=1 Tax=Streptomyces sp. SID13031 TaxID=2706046 RepID=UPI0013CBF5C2|nr:hypothetical protein [Streptomyces sp. SID13031]NEA35300.1 hypothetical protein [Streptomyces sp. SID13031]
MNWFNGGFGGRYVAVKQRDRDRLVTAWAVADTVTGKLVNLAGRGQTVDRRIPPTRRVRRHRRPARPTNPGAPQGLNQLTRRDAGG